ncbi:transmembrane protein 65-like [Haliotis rubra]|uniref:transmembrane protein 65-like n=1 Tax=Haliotis rubra TaxID=36100 RepID=UPI001EE5E458|nr:transmembrane protein 65-like [Haliotis rubra]
MGLAFHNALPFIGFGFFDNFIMIVCGEYIDSTPGAVLGISTMAAAGLGNLISDVAGLGSASYVERLAAAAGVRAPPLTPPQLDMRSTRFMSSFGKIFGISLGCLIGMFPLLFFKDDEKKTEEKSEIESTETSEKA